MSAAQDVARMLTLVPWLLERPGASVTETANAFGVDAARIREDLAHLDFCGLPGLGGGDLFEVSVVADRIVVHMADELRRPLRLTPHEALRLVLTVQAVADVTGDELPALRSALEKLRAAVGVPAGAAVHVAADGGQWLPTIRDAVAGGVRLELTYQGRADEAPQPRTVDPWTLHVAQGYWYLQGHDHTADDRRTFRLDRIAALTVLDERVTVAPPPGAPAPPRYSPARDDVEVVLSIEPPGRWLLDTVDVDERHDAADGSSRVRLRTDAPIWLARLVIAAGGAVTVIEPADLAAEVRALADATLGRY